MGKPLGADEERSRQEQQRSNHMRRPSVLPDLNLLFSPSENPTNRPDEDALIPNDPPSDLPDSKSSSDDEVLDEDDGDSDDEDEDLMSQLAQIYVNRELAILTNWMEELRREILLINEELQILQKKLGVNPKRSDA